MSKSKRLRVGRVTVTHHYETKIKVSDAELATPKMVRHRFHGDWNYTIKESRKLSRLFLGRPLGKYFSL